MDTYQSYPRPQGNYPVDNYEHEEKRSTGSNSNRIYEEPIPQSSAVSGNIYEDGNKSNSNNINNLYPNNNIENNIENNIGNNNENNIENNIENSIENNIENNIENSIENNIENNNSNSNSEESSKRVIAVNSAVAPENFNSETNTVNINSKRNTNSNKNTNSNTNSTISKNNENNKIYNNNNIANPKNNSNNISNATPNSTNNNNKNISNAAAPNLINEDDDEDGVTDNLLNVEELDSQYFKPRPLTRSTIRAATTTVTRTYTRTYTRTSVPTTVNNNINRTPNNNVNRTPSSNTYNNQNSNQNINNNRSSQGQQYTKTIPSQINNNRNTANSYGQSALGSNSNRQSGTGISPGNGIGKNGLGTIPEDNDVTQNNAPSNLDAAIAPEGAGTGFHTGSTIDQDIDQIQTNSDNDQKPNSNFSFIIILIAIPIIIIIIIGSIFFLKKYKNGKRGSNIVYPDDKIRKSNLFGTLQFFNPKKPNRVSISSGSRGSRGSRTNLTSFSNDRESNVPEYSEWLEAGSNTLSMPRVSPPPLNDDKINGLTGSNFAMGVNIDNHNNNNGTLTSAQINRPQAARMAWKLEGMRVGRDSTRKSERQSLFNSFQVW